MRRKNIKQILKEHYLTNPNDKLRLREIERKLQLPLPSISRYTQELIQEHILEKITIGTTTFYTANKSNTTYKHTKKIHNLQKIYESGLIEHLRREYHNPTITLFGSYEKGEDDEQSDIDIYIETPSNKELKLKAFEEKLKRSIQLHTHSNIQTIPNKHLANNIINGTQLNKKIEVFT